MHPEGTIKGHYRWRLYCMDRAQQAGVDDNGIGVLFGLYDWRFEVMGLLYHTIHLEETFNGVGPHTISFPRIKPATGTPFSHHPEYEVSDRDFKKTGCCFASFRTVYRYDLHRPGTGRGAQGSDPLRRFPNRCGHTHRRRGVMPSLKVQTPFRKKSSLPLGT